MANDPSGFSETQAITILCRDCLKLDNGPARARCGACGSPRLVTHPELADLAIAHIDCDAFYATIEKRDNPELRDVPVIVGGGTRGVVSAACYIARTYGIHSAMPMFKARKACPDAVVIRPDMDKYVAVGRQVRELMRALTPLVEPLSIDEAFLDLTGTARLHKRTPAQSLAALIAELENKLGITASVGLSHNKFLAKIASDLDKPRGFSVIGRAETAAFLERQKVGVIWGVGAGLQQRLTKDGIGTIGELRRHDLKTLAQRYGAIGERLYRLARGEDSRAVVPNRPVKSVSSETTFRTDIGDLDDLEAILWRQTERTSRRLKEKGLAGRTVVLKLKTARFTTVTRSTTLDEPTALADRIFRAARPALAKLCDGTRYRLLGIGVTDLTSFAGGELADLFDDEARRARAETAMDDIRRKFGDEAVLKGRGLAARRDRES